MVRPHLRLVSAPAGAPPSAPAEGGGVITEERLEELRGGVKAAERELVALFWPRISRTLTHVLGATHEIEDLVQEVLIRVFARLDRIRDAASLRPFVTSTTVFVAREALRRRSRRRWLVFMAPEDTPDIELPGASPDTLAAVGAFYDVLAKLAVDERIAFSLRYVDGMELTEVAWATETSLSTVKRRLRAAEARFSKLASSRPELEELLKEGTRWQAVAR